MTTGKIPIYSGATGKTELVDPVEKTEAEWRSILPAQTFEVAGQVGHGHVYLPHLEIGAAHNAVAGDGQRHRRQGGGADRGEL